MHLSVRDFFGDLALVAFWHRTPKEREERFGSIARATAGEWLGPAYDDYFAPDPPMPSALDRRILAEHVADATASAETLHLRVGASARRVRASLRQMWNAGVYIHEWRLNRSRVKRAVPFILHVRATPGKAGALARRLQTLFDDTLLAAIPPPARATSACYVVLAANSLEQTEELRERALRAPEASLVLPLLPRSGWDDYSEYEKERDAFLARQ